MADNDDVKKQLEELVGLNKQLLKQNEDLKTVNAGLQKDINELLEKAEDDTMCKMEDGSMGYMKGGVCVAKIDKAAVPESVQKVLDAQSVQIRKQSEELAKMRDESETRDWITKAAGYPSLPIKADALGPILKAAAGIMSKEQFTDFERVLKAGDAACKELTKVSGSSGGDGVDSAYEKMSGLAKVEQAKSSITFEKAFEKIAKQNPDLMRKHREEQRALRQH